MLTLLKIHNLALVDELLWEPHHGYLSITGETGAGKSVIMGGISLALGERGDKSMIRSGEEQCSIEAVFQLGDTARIDRQLEESGINTCEDGTLVIRRIMTATGNRQYINACPATLKLLREIGMGLVDMHHPDDHRSLTSQERQLSLLDAYAENHAARETYRSAWLAWSEARRAVRTLEEAERTNERELDYLRHQIEEIEEAGLSENEATELEARWQRTHNAARLHDTAIPMARLLEGDDNSLIPQLRQLIRHARDLVRLDPSADTWTSPLEGIAAELEECTNSLRDYTERLDLDPETMANLSERINKLDTLKRKYGSDYSAIEAHLQTCRARLDEIDNRDERLEELRRQEQLCREKLASAAGKLTATRREAAPRLAKDIVRHARELGFKQARFDISLTPLNEPGAHGAEETEFLFGPNPGEPLKALRLIASSGELARVMLALKSALARQDDTPLLIFDEIDANVGGEIALAVGLKMRQLGSDHQVISITHFPQVAALAAHHYLIEKKVSSGRTVSSLREVAEEERIDELVRMLGGGGNTARAHARELLA